MAGCLNKITGLPNKNSFWEIVKGSELGPNSPITLQWTSAEKVEFIRNIEIDENFLISVEQKVVNKSDKELSLTQYGRIKELELQNFRFLYIA